jgi:hypothetical protein
LTDFEETGVCEVRILAVFSGEYGTRHVANVREHAPESWSIETWHAPAVLPPVIDYPEDYIPASFPPAELLLSFAEHRGVAELIPEIAGLCGARSVLAPVDNENWLPRGLARQLRGWLGDMGVFCATPKPLCSLTETEYLVARRERVRYDDPFVAEFAHYFGRPEIRLTVDPQDRTIVAAELKRDAVCGCARYVAERLVGLSADEAEQQSGMLHHHFPCLASMGIDPDFSDTLMHVSGNILRDSIAEQVKPYKQVQYVRPGIKEE